MDFPDFAWIILRHGTYFFLLEKSEIAKQWPCHWGFPGGKQERWETLFQTAQRELEEEIAVTVRESDILAHMTIEATYIDGTRRITLFLLDSWEGIPENLEPKIHSDMGWYSIDTLPHPMIPHVKAGLLALLHWDTTLIYDGIPS